MVNTRKTLKTITKYQDCQLMTKNTDLLNKTYQLRLRSQNKKSIKIIVKTLLKV
jgi:hypothetical protein